MARARHETDPLVEIDLFDPQTTGVAVAEQGHCVFSVGGLLCGIPTTNNIALAAAGAYFGTALEI